MTEQNIYGDFTESNQVSAPTAMYRFLDLANA